MRLGTRVRRAVAQLLRAVGRRPKFPAGVPFREREHQASLLGLPPELLHYIIGYVNDEWKNLRLSSVSKLASPPPKSTSSAVKALSTVNRHLRELCLPILFRLIEIDPSGPLPTFNILPYFRSMNVNTTVSSQCWEISEEFVHGMRQLERVYWHGEGMLKQASLSRMRLLLTSPSLHTLILNNVWLLADAIDWSTAASSLRTLRVDFSHQVQDRSRSNPEFIEAHLSCFDSVLDHLRPRLESLTLSGYSVKLSSLASAPWPSLHTPSLTRGNAVLDVSWGTVFCQMPALNSLTIALDRGETPRVIFPDAAAARASSSLTNLRHFTISFAHPGDQVFANLPPDLQGLWLSLRESPRYYTNRSHWRETSDVEPILSCPDVLRIFSVLSATNLRALELVYLEDPDEFEMLALLSESCPRLTLLELHRYPETPGFQDAWCCDRLPIPVEAIADALAAFKSLNTLKLNLRFTNHDVTRFVGSITVDYWERLDRFLESQAYKFVARIPWIEMLSFLTLSTCRMHWDTWSVRPGGPEGGPQLVHEIIYHESFYGCQEFPSF